MKKQTFEFAFVSGERTNTSNALPPRWLTFSRTKFPKVEARCQNEFELSEPRGGGGGDRLPASCQRPLRVRKAEPEGRIVRIRKSQPERQPEQQVLSRVARFFLVQQTKTGKYTKGQQNMPNSHKIDQMASK
jgi:hypothetical protein